MAAVDHDPRSDERPVLGAQNARVKELRRQLGRHNARSSLVVLEGPRTIGEALQAGISMETIVVSESGVGVEAVAEVRARLATDVETLIVRDHVFERLAPTVTPPPLLALAARPAPAVPERLTADAIVLVLVDVADPGNVGTLVRVADAVAATCVVVVGGADPWGDKAIRASAGSILRVPVVGSDDVADALEALRTAGATIVATDVRHGPAHDRGALRPPVAIVLGSEAHGLPPGVDELVDGQVHIEMPGRAESLNVAMAGTLLAFEARREPA